jgi:hypothetical protein
MADNFIQLGNSNRGLMLNEYKGEYSIAEAREAQDGKIWMDFCYPQFKQAPQDKAVPKGVKLGPPAQAYGILRQLLQQLEAEMGTTNTPAAAASVMGGKVVEDDIPF